MTNISFNQVSIVEQYSEVPSRSEVDCSTDMGKFSMNIPIISANMPQITEETMAACMYRNGGRGILHRFSTIDDNVSMYRRALSLLSEVRSKDNRNAPDQYAVGVSIGVQTSDKNRFTELYKAGARLFCIDVAHGHHILVKKMIEWIRTQAEDVYLIAGNVARSEGARDLAKWGVDAIKVGIGPGSVCATRKNTGVGTPQFSAIQNAKAGIDCSGCDGWNEDGTQIGGYDYRNVKIIADGGIKNVGDIPKALAAGADAVMVGAVLAGTTETPGNVYPCPDTDLWNRQYYKVYGGSASGENKVSTGKEHKFVEGVMKTVPFKGKAKYILNEIRDGLRSSLSYSGASNMQEFKQKVKYEIMGESGIQESKL
jgi:IMP dehydrogenase